MVPWASSSLGVLCGKLDPDPTCFQQIPQELSAVLGKPWLLYVPFFCPSNVYMKQFKFLHGSHGATAFTVPYPDDALAFYRMLFDYALANGLSVLLLRPFPAVVPYRLIGNQPVP